MAYKLISFFAFTFPRMSSSVWKQSLDLSKFVVTVTYCAPSIASLLYTHVQIVFPRKIYKVPLHYPQTHKDLWYQPVTPEITKAYTVINIRLWTIPKFVGLERKVCARLSKPITIRKHQYSRYCIWRVNQSINFMTKWEYGIQRRSWQLFWAIKLLKYQVTEQMPHCKCHKQYFMGLQNEIIIDSRVLKK